MRMVTVRPSYPLWGHRPHACQQPLTPGCAAATAQRAASCAARGLRPAGNALRRPLHAHAHSREQRRGRARGQAAGHAVARRFVLRPQDTQQGMSGAAMEQVQGGREEGGEGKDGGEAQGGTMACYHPPHSTLTSHAASGPVGRRMSPTARASSMKSNCSARWVPPTRRGAARAAGRLYSLWRAGRTRATCTPFCLLRVAGLQCASNVAARASASSLALAFRRPRHAVRPPSRHGSCVRVRRPQPTHVHARTGTS